MASSKPDIDALLAKVQSQEAELLRLRSELAKALSGGAGPSSAQSERVPKENESHKWPLDPEEYQRYGRQMILSEVGLQGQIKFRNASVLIIGLGGLGCPAAAYLAGAGVGALGLVDGDTVELSNLHRQILHTTATVGSLKVESAASQLRKRNPRNKYNLYPSHLTPASAIPLFKQYDLVLDCTDHPTSRYLISDAAVLAGIPLVSASALKTEGQLLVLNNPPRKRDRKGGPCYRCIFPRPPAADTALSCGEGGILGPVVGVMGILMAVEALKVLTDRGSDGETVAEAGSSGTSPPEPHSMLIYSAYSSIPFRTLKMKGKRHDCMACSDAHSITENSLLSGSLDYVVFCGMTSPVMVLASEERVEATEYAKARETGEAQVLVDVRDETQFGICNLQDSVNIPFRLIESVSASGDDSHVTDNQALHVLRQALENVSPDTKLYTVCRFGNDSQVAVRRLKELGFGNDNQRWIGDIRGGFQAWKKEVDPTWPQY